MNRPVKRPRLNAHYNLYAHNLPTCVHAKITYGANSKLEKGVCIFACSHGNYRTVRGITHKTMTDVNNTITKSHLTNMIIINNNTFLGILHSAEEKQLRIYQSNATTATSLLDVAVSKKIDVQVNNITFKQAKKGDVLKLYLVDLNGNFIKHQ